MAGITIERNRTDLVVLGQVQYDYSVNGKQGVDYGVAVLESAFARSVVYEGEMTAVSAAIRKRQEKVNSLNYAMGIINSALTWVGTGTGDSKITVEDDATKKTKYKDASGKEQIYYTAAKNSEINTIFARYGLTAYSDTKFGTLQKRQADLRAALETENNELQQHTSFAKTLMTRRDNSMQQVSKIMKKTWSSAKLAIQSIGN